MIANILQQPVRALILLSFGVGNAPQNPAMLALLSEASARGVIIVNLSQCLHGKVNMGAMPPATPSPVRESSRGFDMTAEAAPHQAALPAEPGSAGAAHPRADAAVPAG